MHAGGAEDERKPSHRSSRKPENPTGWNLQSKRGIGQALSAMEQLKENFNKKRADWATEKSALIKRAEDAEAALKPVTNELTSIKRHVHAMTTAIFGKPVFLLNWLCLLTKSPAY